MSAEELRGASRKYEALPSSEKEKIDRRMEDITRDVERHEESKIKDGKNMIKSLSKELTSYAYGHVLNGGYINVPNTVFLEDGAEIACSCCKGVYGAVYRKGTKWVCEMCKDDIAGEIEDTFYNYKK